MIQKSDFLFLKIPCIAKKNKWEIEKINNEFEKFLHLISMMSRIMLGAYFFDLKVGVKSDAKPAMVIFNARTVLSHLKEWNCV